MPEFHSSLTFAEKEEAADYVAVDITLSQQNHTISLVTTGRADFKALAFGR